MRLRKLHIKRGSSLVMAGLVGAALAAPILTSAAGADTPTSGYIEICKAFAPPPISISTTATFTFNITGVDSPVTVTAGSCSGEISVPVGMQTITETPAPWYTVGSITELPGQSYLTSTDLSSGTATVSVAPGDNVEEVTYTNDPVTGYLEVCKQATQGSGLTGTFSFDVTGADGFTTSTDVPVGACSPAIEVPAGSVTVAEAGSNLYVTGITAAINGTTDALVGGPDLTTGTADVTISPSADASTQTDLTYTNDVVALKVCKVWDSSNGDEPGGAATTFPFSFTASGAAGPNSAPSPVSLTAGTQSAPVCSNPVSYRPGTTVSITEGIVPGTKAEDISATGAGSIVPDSVSLTDRTISVVVGTPTTSSWDPTDEAIVTYTDEAADPGMLKICKTAGSPAPVGTVFSFTVAGLPGTTDVPVGSCAIVGGSESPVLFPFNSTQTITESASTGNATSAISVIPTFVTELVGTTPTLTSESVVAGTPTLGGTDTVSSVSVVIGEGTFTEATFTDIDPPSMPATSGGGTVTVGDPGGSNSGTTTASSPAIAASVAAAVNAANSGSTQSGAASSSTIRPTISSAHKVALLRDEKALVRITAAIRHAEKLARHTRGTAHRSAAKHLTALLAQARHLRSEIRALK